MVWRLDALAQRFAHALVRRPSLTAAWLVGLLAIAAVRLPSITVDAGTSSFIAAKDPARVFQATVERQFIGEDLLFIGYETDDVFSEHALRELRALDAKLLAISMPVDGGTRPLVDDVESLTTVKDVDGADQRYRTVPLVPDDIPTDADGLRQVRARALNNPMIRQSMLSNSPGVAGIMVRLVKGLDDEAFAVVVARVRALINEGAAGPTRYYLAGDPVATVDTATYQEQDLERFIPISYALLMGSMLLFMRRVLGVVVALVNATFAMFFGMGMVAYCGKLTNLSSIMPPLVMVLSVATVVHFVSEFAHHSAHLGRLDAAEKTIRELFVPTFMCELTTAVGFISFSFSAIPALHEFGIAAALAVMGAFFLSFLGLAIVVRFVSADQLLRPSRSWLSVRIDEGLAALTELSIRRPWAMLVGVSVMTVASVFGVARLKVNHDDIDQFSQGLPLRVATEFMNEKLGGSGEVVVSIQTDEENRFFDPAELKRLEALQQFLEHEFGASATFSFADYVKLMHRGFNGDDAAAYRLPETREQVAQLVFLNGDDRLSQFVDPHYRWVRVSARTAETGSAELTRRFGELERYLKAHFPEANGYRAHGSGSTYLSVVLGNNILDSQASSFLISLLLIFVPIALMFGSAVAGAFTIPPNVFPILACLGLMGWAGIALDISTTMIASIILGIAVDDTIHFVQNIRTLLGQGLDMQAAIRKTMSTKGVGALWITVIISLGFIALAASSFKPTAAFGLLTAFGMISGAVAEMCLLPPLLLITKTRLGVKAPRAESSQPAVLGHER